MEEIDGEVKPIEVDKYNIHASTREEDKIQDIVEYSIISYFRRIYSRNQ